MPFVNGVFHRLYSWVTEQAGGNNISPVKFDADGNDIAAALSTTMLRDGTSTATADLPMSSHSLTGIRAAVAAGEPVEFGQWQSSGRLVGEIIDFGGATAPAKWLMCDGSAVSRTTYALLFAAIGTAFGNGDGSTTFNLPDLRGRSTFGADAMGGTSATGGTAANRVTSAISGIAGGMLGAAGGDQQMQSHAHQAAAGSTNVLVPNSLSLGSTGSTGNQASRLDLSTVATSTTGAGASQNMPPALVVAKIIYAAV